MEPTKKDAILRAAQELFGRQGYSGTTVKQVAERAGVAFGLVAHYFGNKETLFLTAGFDMADRLLARLRKATDASPTGLEAVAAFVSTYLGYTEEHRRRFPVLIRCSPFSDVPNMLDRERIAAKFQEIFAVIQRCVARGVQDGTIRGVPEEETAALVFSNIMGAVRTRFLTPYALPGLYRETVRYVVRSLATDVEAALKVAEKP